jgi:protease II
MTNNDNTLAIDYGCYGSTFDMIFSSRVGFLASHDRHGVYLGWWTSKKRGGGDEGHQ